MGETIIRAEAHSLATYPPEGESSRTHFEVLGLGLKASSPRKLACPRLEDSTMFEPLKFRWKTPETLRKICEDLFLVSSSRYRLKKTFEDLFCLKKIFEDLFFWRTLASVSLGFGLGLGRVCPWPRIFFVSLALASSLVSSTPPLIPTLHAVGLCYWYKPKPR